MTIEKRESLQAYPLTVEQLVMESNIDHRTIATLRAEVARLRAALYEVRNLIAAAGSAGRAQAAEMHTKADTVARTALGE